MKYIIHILCIYDFQSVCTHNLYIFKHKLYYTTVLNEFALTHCGIWKYNTLIFFYEPMWT